MATTELSQAFLVLFEQAATITRQESAEGMADAILQYGVTDSKIKAEVANVASLPPANESVRGDIRWVIDQGKYYTFSDITNTWSVLGSENALVLGETSTTAYRGDRGKIAYDHSQIFSGNPHNTLTMHIADYTGTTTALVASGIAAHVAETDPHYQYITPSEVGTLINTALDAHEITSGVISVPGPEWTLKTAPNVITIASCQARLYDNPNWIGRPKTYTIPAKDFTLTEWADTMLIVHYNGGTPEYRIVDAWDFTAYNLSDNCLVYRFWYAFGEIHSVSLDSIGNGLCEKQALRLGQTNYYSRTGNVGLALGETSTPAVRTVTITAANVWAGPLAINVLGFNSSTDKLEFITKNAGIWTESDITQWPNTVYNDNAGPITMSNNKYGVLWFYRTIGDVKETYVVCGKSQYNTAQDAASESPRDDLPLMLYSHAMFVGRFIFQKSANAAYAIQSAFSTAFSSVPSTAITASMVLFTPTGSVSSSDVQAAIAEVDAEKMTKPSLTINYIPKATGTATIGNSALIDTGTSITTAYDITPASTGNASLGTSTLRFANVDAGGIFTENIQPRFGGALKLLDTTGVVRMQVTNAGTLDFSGHVTFANDDIYNIGSTTLKPHYIFASKVYTSSVDGGTSALLLSGSSITTTNTLKMNGGFTNIGSGFFSRVNPLELSMPGYASFGRASDNAAAGQVGFAQTTAADILLLRNSAVNGAIKIFAGDSSTPGDITLGTGGLDGATTSTWMTVNANGVVAYRNLSIRSTSAQTAGSELRFFPTYNDSDSGKQFISWWNTTEDTRRALIGYREGALPDTNDKDLRIVSTYPSGTAMATGFRGVRIGTALDTTSEAGTGSFTVAPYGTTYAGIWPGAIPAASRTSENYTLLSGNANTWLNAPSASGMIGMAVNNVSMVTIENNVITCFTGTSGAMVVNGNSFVANSATVDMSSTTTTYLPGATFSAYPVFSKVPVMATTTSGLTSGNYAWNMDTYRDVLFSSTMTGTININISNPRAGRTNTFAIYRGATAYTITLNCTGVDFFWTGGAANADTFTIQTSSMGTASRWYAFTLTWLNASTCLVGRPVL